MNGEDSELPPDVLNWLRSTSSSSSWQPKTPISPASFGSANEGYHEVQGIDRRRHSRWRRTEQTTSEVTWSSAKIGSNIEHDNVIRSKNRNLKPRDLSIQCVVRRKLRTTRMKEGNARVLSYFSSKINRRPVTTCSRLRHMLNFKFNSSESTVTCVDDEDDDRESNSEEPQKLATSLEVYQLEVAAVKTHGTSPLWTNLQSPVTSADLSSNSKDDTHTLSVQPTRSRRDVNDEHEQLDGDFYDADDSWKTGNGEVNVNDTGATVFGDSVNDRWHNHDVFAYAVKMQKIAHMLHYCSIAILGLFVLQVSFSRFNL
jgi:hypothetical protein